MNVTVFGAGGKVGRLVVRRLVDDGHSVHAFVHTTPQNQIDGVTYIQGDVKKADDVAKALDGAVAVISCLGSWGTKTKDILSVGMQIIVPIMEQRGIRRMVSLTGADAWSHNDYAELGKASYNMFAISDHRPMILRSMMHGIFSIIARKIIHDSETHIQILENSTLDWTIVRSPVMNSRGRNGYDLSTVYPLPWATVHREAVARAICDQLTSSQYVRKLPYIGRI